MKPMGQHVLAGAEDPIFDPGRMTRRRLERALALLAGVAALVPSPAGAAADPLRPQQWALDRIEPEPAWKQSRGAGVTIAVVDTGIDLDHPDLASKIHADYTCIGGPCRSGGGDDDHGHGTHVAGIAAAATGNGKGIAGVAPDARLIAVKVLNSKGEGTCDDVAEGIAYATDKGARVINLSLGSEIDLLLVGLPLPSCVDALEAAAEHAWDTGAVVAIAAGNTSLPASFYASQALEVVGATGPDDRVASYSSTGATDVFAPGGDAVGDCDAADCIASTYKDGQYAVLQGTSVATPHVSGVAALLLAQGKTNSQAVTRINSTGDTTPDGERRVDAAAAVGSGSSGGGSQGGGSGAGSIQGPRTSTPGGGSPPGASVTPGGTPLGSASPSIEAPTIEGAKAAPPSGGEGSAGGVPTAAVVGLGTAIVILGLGARVLRAALRRR